MRKAFHKSGKIPQESCLREVALKLYQKLADQIGQAIETEFGIMDKDGLILGCTNVERVGEIHPGASIAARNDERFSVVDGATFQKILNRNKLESITWINSADSSCRQLLSLISINVVNLRSYHEDKFDRCSFIRSLIMDQIPAAEIAMMANELHMTAKAPRAFFLIKTEGAQHSDVLNVLKNLFPNETKDAVVAVDERAIVLIRELKKAEEGKEPRKLAKTIIDTINTELMIKARVGIGNTAESLSDLASAYRNAETALETGDIFEKDKTVMDYNRLGIGRLINQLPEDLCRLYLNEVLNEGFFETIDNETLVTVQKLFDNNLNISEASRQLYLHRNTLVYRLDKIQKSTGLDLRSFEDAITFKLCMMVRKYLDNKELQRKTQK